MAITTMRERRDGYLLAHQKHGLTVSPELMRFGSPKPAGGYAGAQELLQLQPPPTAIFAANNMITLGVLRAIQDRGQRIPDDISIVCFGDMPWATLLYSPLTVIAQPDYELGHKAAELLLERLKQPGRPAFHVQLKLDLIVRASTGQPALQVA